MIENWPIELCDSLSQRVKNILKRLGIVTVSEVVVLTDTNLIKIPGCGEKSVREIKEFIDKYRMSVVESLLDKKEETPKNPDDPTFIKIEDTNLHGRIKAMCRRHNIVTVNQLASWSETDLLKERNIGRRYVSEINELLAKYNLELGLPKPTLVKPNSKCILCNHYMSIVDKNGIYRGYVCSKWLESVDKDYVATCVN